MNPQSRGDAAERGASSPPRASFYSGMAMMDVIYQALVLGTFYPVEGRHCCDPRSHFCPM